MVDSSFYPDLLRAKALDARMRSELAFSLQELSEQIETQLPDDRGASLCSQTRSVLPLLESGKRVSPALFSGYYQLVGSLLNNDEDVDSKFESLVSAAKPLNSLVYREFSSDGLGGDDILALYTSALDTDERIRFDFLKPSSENRAKTQVSIQRALRLMQQSAPNLAAEFRELVIEIVLAGSSEDPKALHFDGASSYMLWGALVLNVIEEKSDLEMMETLAHEAGHSFLFGMTVDETLVLNDDDDLFESPLRIDPRPMDGIYHATFVSARMHYAMKMASDSRVLTDDQPQEATTLLAASRKAFEDGYSVVASHAMLSRTGKALLDDAYNFMENQA